MRLATVFLIGAAVAGVTGLAVAAAPAVHEMTVALPNGGTAHIRYTGDVAPKVKFVQGPASPFVMTAFGPGFGPASPFAEIEHIQAQMDRQMAVMMLQARQMQAAAMRDPVYSATFNGVPAGDNAMRFVSTSSGNTYCFRSVQVTASPNGGAPKVVSRSEGNCGQSPAPQLKAPAATAASPSPKVPLQTISYQPRKPSPHPRQGI
jgi:hypothetical protein